MKKTLAAAAALAFLAGPALAQAPEFAAVDADGDGALTLAEVKAALPDVDEATIVAADADNNGALSAEEYAALVGG